MRALRPGNRPVTGYGNLRRSRVRDAHKKGPAARCRSERASPRARSVNGRMPGRKGREEVKPHPWMSGRSPGVSGFRQVQPCRFLVCARANCPGVHVLLAYLDLDVIPLRIPARKDFIDDLPDCSLRIIALVQGSNALSGFFFSFWLGWAQCPCSCKYYRSLTGYSICFFHIIRFHSIFFQKTG